MYQASRDLLVHAVRLLAEVLAELWAGGGIERREVSNDGPRGGLALDGLPEGVQLAVGGAELLLGEYLLDCYLCI